MASKNALLRWFLQQDICILPIYKHMSLYFFAYFRCIQIISPLKSLKFLYNIKYYVVKPFNMKEPILLIIINSSFNCIAKIIIIIII